MRGGAGFFRRRVGNCLLGDGIDDGVTIAHNNNFNLGTSDFFMSCSIKMVNINKSLQSIVKKDLSNNYGWLCFFILGTAQTGSVPTFIIALGSTSTSWLVYHSESVNVVVGDWVELAISRSGNFVYCFVNQKLVGTYNIGTVAVYDTSNPIVLFRENYIADSRLCNNALANFLLIKGIPFKTGDYTQLDYRNLPAETVFYFPISEGTGTTINSKVGGYTGTMSNFDAATCWQKQNKFLFP